MPISIFPPSRSGKNTYFKQSKKINKSKIDGGTYEKKRRRKN